MGVNQRRAPQKRASRQQYCDCDVHPETLHISLPRSGWVWNSAAAHRKNRAVISCPQITPPPKCKPFFLTHMMQAKQAKDAVAPGTATQAGWGEGFLFPGRLRDRYVPRHGRTPPPRGDQEGSPVTNWLPYTSRRGPALRPESMAPLFDALAPERERWLRRNRYYYRQVADLCRFVIPPGSRVLEIGCGTGDLLAAVSPGRGLGIDVSPKMAGLAAARHPALEFRSGDAENLEVDETFDYVILSDVVGHLFDVQRAFAVIVTSFNYLWEAAAQASGRPCG